MNSVVFDLDHAIEVLRGMDKPIADAVRDEELRGKLEALRISLKAASTTAGDMISQRRRPHPSASTPWMEIDMDLDRRELLIGLGSSALALGLPWHRAKAAN